MYPYTMQHYPFFILTAVIVNISPESPHNSGISGTINFDQKSKEDPLIIKGSLSGLVPGKHGLHVHELKFDGVDCSSAGGHFNPKQVSFKMKLTLMRETVSCRPLRYFGMILPYFVMKICYYLLFQLAN